MPSKTGRTIALLAPPMVAVALLLCACPGASAPASKPVIHAFAADPATLEAGGSSILSWQVSGADGLRLDPGAHDVTGSVQRPVTPSATTH